MGRQKRIRPGDRGKRTIVRDHTGKAHDCDSKMEARRLMQLDLAGYRVEREGLKIPYTFEGKRHYYLPDLLVYNYAGRLVRVEECKPRVRQGDAINQAKWAAARLWCKSQGVDFWVVNENELGKL